MNKILSYLNQLLSLSTNLLIVCLLLACVASYDGRLFGKPIANLFKKTVKPKDLIVAENPFLENDNWQKIKRDIWQKNDKDGNVKETVVFSKRHAKGVSGYGGPISLAIFLDEKAIISNVEIGENYETPVFLNNVLNSGFLNQFKGKLFKKFNRQEYDTVTGATVSSRAIIESLSKSAEAYRVLMLDKPAETKKDVPLPKVDYKILLASLIVLFALLLFLFFKGNKLFRTIQLTLNVVVLGGVCGVLLSMQTFFNIVANGINLKTGFALLFIITVIMVLNLMGKKNFYCTWVCPFGSAQDLAGRLSKKNIIFPKKYQQLLLNLRNIILLFLLFMSWVFGAGYIFDYEPFSAFLFTQASPLVLAIAGGFLVLSVFIKKCWCRFFCPTGAILNFIQTTK